MSTWEDLFTESEMDPPVAYAPATELIRRDLTPVSVTGPVRRVIDSAGTPDESTFLIGISTEPAPGIVRLALQDDETVHIARCPKGGWWVVDQNEVPPDHPGWTWDAAAGSPAVFNRRARVVYPQVRRPYGRMVQKLISSLPDDGQWYRVAIWNGEDVYGRSSHSLKDIRVGTKEDPF